MERVEEIAEKVKTEFNREGFLSEDSLKYLRQQWEKHEKSEGVSRFMNYMIPIYLEIIDSEPQFSENPKQKTRHEILDLLSKLIHAHNPFNNEIFTKILGLLERDNETNAKIGAKILNDLIKQGSQQNQRLQGQPQQNI